MTRQHSTPARRTTGGLFRCAALLALAACGGGGSGGGAGPAPAPVPPKVPAASRVDDLAPGAAPEEGSFPFAFTDVGSLTFFSAFDSATGQELWVTDGTGNGTHQVADLAPGARSAHPTFLTEFRGRLYFLADDGAHGRELHVSDGTSGGTERLTDLAPGITGGVTEIEATANLLFLSGGSPPDRELWAYDGNTFAEVKDIAAGAAGSNPRSLTDVGGQLLFRATTAATGEELWISDGSLAGTRPVVELVPGPGDAGIGSLTAAAGRLFFTADDGVAGKELWASDGTAAGTDLFDIKAGAGSSSPVFLTAGPDGVYFSASPGATGDEPHFCDGADVVLLGDVRPGSSGSSPWSFVPADGYVVFAADDGVAGRELWVSDGTAASAQLLADVVAGSGSSQLVDGLAVGPHVFLSLSTSTLVGELWVTDGTGPGTVLVKKFQTSGFQPPSSFHNLAGRLLFQADDGQSGVEPWTSRGTCSTTHRLADLNRGPASSHPQEAVSAGPRLLFRARGAGVETELWEFDGTQVSLAADVDPGPGNALLTEFNGDLFFAAEDPVQGKELYRLQGDQLTVFDLDPARSAIPRAITVHDGALFIEAHDNIWKSDGTLAGTALFETAIQTARDPTSTGDSLYFAAHVNSAGLEVWHSDGVQTLALVMDILPGSGSSRPAGLTAAGKRLFFYADDGTSGPQLWVTDGPAGETVRLTSGTQIDDAGTSNVPLVAAGNRVFFDLEDPSAGRELWSSDGTPTGTGPVLDIGPGLLDGVARGTTAALGNRVLFAADDGVAGLELWHSNGTPGGTLLLKDLVPGARASSPHNLLAVPALGKVFFAAHRQETGVELWESDGTSAGTRLLADVRPGSLSSSPRPLAHHEGRLYFSATDGASGFELWSVEVRAAP